jgi:hypothetical protein
MHTISTSLLVNGIRGLTLAPKSGARVSLIAFTGNPALLGGTDALLMGLPMYSVAISATGIYQKTGASTWALSAGGGGGGPDFTAEITALQSDVASLLAATTALGAADTTLAADIAALQTADTALDTRVTALESAGPGGAVTINDWYWSNVDPISTNGVDGARWVNTTLGSRAVFIKVAGAWVVQPGTVVWATGAPGPGDGADDDYCIDRTTGLTYGPKAGGAWPGTVAGRINIGPDLLVWRDDTEQAPVNPNGANGTRIHDVTFTPPWNCTAVVGWDISFQGDGSGNVTRVGVRHQNTAAVLDEPPAQTGELIGGVKSGTIATVTHPHHNMVARMVNGQLAYPEQRSFQGIPVVVVGGTPSRFTMDLAGTSIGSAPVHFGSAITVRIPAV